MTNQSPKAIPTVFTISDGTGVTADAIARSVLIQFDINFKKIRLPFISTKEKAQQAAERIQRNKEQSQVRPIVFSTLVKPEFQAILHQADALHIDLINPCITRLSAELKTEPKQEIGLSHQRVVSHEYEDRMEAIQFSIAHDDGRSLSNLEMADIILLGVSRSGKTPTSLYLAIQYGLKTANYPLVPEDFDRKRLPKELLEHKSKIFGLSIDPTRLSHIREARFPNSKYATLDNCRYEVRAAEMLMEKEGIVWLSSTNRSIEEISSTIVQKLDSYKQSE
jgi:hypothetical protein